MSDVEMHEGSSSRRADENVYDPDQDPFEKRNVRKDYRNLHKRLDGNNNDYTVEDLANHVKKADTLFDKVKGPQEATLDSAFLLMASNAGAQRARALKSGSGGFDTEEFITKLINFMGGQRIEERVQEGSDYEDDDETEPLDWQKIGRKALAKSRRAPAMTFMLGPLAKEQKQRTQGKRARFEKDKEATKPQTLQEEDIQRSENETTKNVHTLREILEGIDGEVNLFKFIINPHDFGQSVENVFHLSFLIKEGIVALELRDAEPVIYLCEAPTDEDRLTGGLRKQQIVFEFDMATWQNAIEAFNITETMIPNRKPPKTRLGNKWYG